jgi:hypothetical protein
MKFSIFLGVIMSSFALALPTPVDSNQEYEFIHGLEDRVKLIISNGKFRQVLSDASVLL